MLGTREIVILPNYVMVYRIEDDGISILRMLHAVTAAAALSIFISISEVMGSEVEIAATSAALGGFQS